MLMATVVILFLSVYALHLCGYSFDLAIDDKSFAKSQLSVMGDDMNEVEALWNPWTDAESTYQSDSVQGGDEGSHPGNSPA